MWLAPAPLPAAARHRESGGDWLLLPPDRELALALKLMPGVGVAPGSVGLPGTPGEAEPLLLLRLFMLNPLNRLLPLDLPVDTGVGLSWLRDSVSVTSPAAGGW